jgi:hypothetical protein
VAAAHRALQRRQAKLDLRRLELMDRVVAAPDAAKAVSKADAERAIAAASVNYRWTPSDAWEIMRDMDRIGTEAQAAFSLWAGVCSPVRPKSRHRSTMLYKTTDSNAYDRTSPWGQRYTFKIEYNDSQYTDNISSYIVQNP